jgi:alkylated DNA repair protein (DNA oxidative demethylase)
MIAGDLFADTQQTLAEGAVLLRSFALADEAALIAHCLDIAAAAPFRNMVTPGGFRMSVAMTNCGALGWVTDRRGYRYAAVDPETEKSWPPMPARFLALAHDAAEIAGFPAFTPDSCLINRYEPGARMALHQDKDERDRTQPIVSVSLGLSAVFQFGGQRRGDRPLRVRLESGDAVVWGGPARLAFHGVAPLMDGTHPLLGAARINLTFRKAG